MRIENDIKLDFDDVLIKPKRSEMPSRAGVELIRSFTTLYSKKTITGIPIIAANLDTTGTFAMARALSKYKIYTCLHKFYKEEDLVNFLKDESLSDYVFYTLGITDDDINKLARVANRIKIKNICVDVANGYTSYFNHKVRMIRNEYPDAVLMAGNVATPEMVQELLINGHADIVKIGIGPGSACTTRLITACGYPQLSAIIECADSAHGLGGLICGDGGCRYPADVVKGFGGGADFMMLGGMLSGTDECEGEWITWANGSKKELKFYGMSSKEAQDKYMGGMSKYKASEGRCMNIPYKGPVDGVIQEILGGLRSACSYVGALKLKSLCKCTTFIRCNQIHNNMKI